MITARDAVFLARLAGCCRNKGAADTEAEKESEVGVEQEKVVVEKEAGESDGVFLARLGCCRRRGQ
jgi:hypothetical protein